MFRNKSLSDELFLHFSFESSESDRVFDYLHDSNSIFRAGRIKSVNVFGRTVRVMLMRVWFGDGGVRELDRLGNNPADLGRWSFDFSGY